jgi:uncharacterized protein YdcH (DUF465 family)
MILGFACSDGSRVLGFYQSHLILGGDTPVSSPAEAIREQLMATNTEYQRLREQHSHYATQLDQLTHKNYLSDQDKLEEVRLKKLKLMVKDQMESLVRQLRGS